MLPPAQPLSLNSFHPRLEPDSSKRLNLERPISLRPSLGTPSSICHNLEQPRRLASLVSDWSLRALLVRARNPEILQFPGFWSCV